MVSLISLGCAKNTVDSERLLAGLVQDGFLLAENPADADLCLVNTCGFIAEARAEADAVLGEIAALKGTGSLKAVVALGCLVERAGQAPDTEAFLRHADARVGFGDYLRLPAVCRALLDAAAPGPSAARALDPSFHRLPRLLTGSSHAVSLKISEGCSHGCRFCTIPKIRGPQVSRPVEEIVGEARQLVDAGAREISLIAQDTTGYGRDLYGEPALPRLLRALAGDIAEPVWFRLMYAYPRHLSDTVLDALASDSRFCPYIDLPLQHIADPILQAMGRGMTRRDTVALLERIRVRLPDAAVRTAFIVGYPGESAAQFDELEAFVREGWFLHAGVFAYSRETGTPAAREPDTVPEPEKQRRRETLLETQQEASRRQLAAWIGRKADVMIDGPAAGGAPAGARWVARLPQQAPEVDGCVYVRGGGVRTRRTLLPGAVIPVCIGKALAYDLVASPA